MRHLLTAVLLLGAIPAAAQSVLITPLTVEDVAYHATSGRLYAVLPAGVGGPESSVAEINPATGAIVTRVAIPDGPGGGARQVALTDDGALLYVGVNGGRSVRRYSVPGFTPGPEFVLGTDLFGQPFSVREMVVAPGTASTLVIARAGPYSAPELAVSDAGAWRPARVYGERIVFHSATRLISSDARYRLDPTGLVADSPARTWTRGLSAAADGIGYDSAGGIADLGTEQVLGTCGTGGTPVPAPDLDTVFYFGSAIATCALSTYRVTGTLALPALGDGFRAALRTGTGRVTLVDGSGRLVVADGLTTPLPVPLPPTGPPWTANGEGRAHLQLTGCVQCRPGDVLAVQGAVSGGALYAAEVKAAVVLPNGAALAVTALGESHLELANLYEGVGATLLRVAIPPGLPPGTWHVEMAFLDPYSGAVLSRASVPFEVTP